jgi:hypothetical protein
MFPELLVTVAWLFTRILEVVDAWRLLAVCVYPTSGATVSVGCQDPSRSLVARPHRGGPWARAGDGHSVELISAERPIPP